jgi:hypothetical protein
LGGYGRRIENSRPAWVHSKTLSLKDPRQQTNKNQTKQTTTTKQKLKKHK